MKQLIILGAGTAGTMMSNHLSKTLPDNWRLTIIDQKEIHHYQPGYLFIPFGTYTESDIVKPIAKFLPSGVQYIQKPILKVNKDEDLVILEDGKAIPYDLLIIATGTDIAPEETPGMLGPHWYKSIFDFYTLVGAVRLHQALEDWEGGHLVVHITEMPIKCPVAPLEFAFF